MSGSNNQLRTTDIPESSQPRDIPLQFSAKGFARAEGAIRAGTPVAAAEDSPRYLEVTIRLFPAK